MAMNNRRTLRRTWAWLFTLLALASLAAGSALLSSAWLGFGTTGGQVAVRRLAIVVLWPPTVLAVWALGTTALFTAGRRRDLVPYLLLLLGVSVIGWGVLGSAVGAPAAVGVLLLSALNCGACYIAWLVILRRGAGTAAEGK